MTLDELRAMLEKHDWYYVYSDDHRYYKKGKASRDKIMEAISTLSDKGLESGCKELYNALSPDDFNMS